MFDLDSHGSDSASTSSASSLCEGKEEGLLPIRAPATTPRGGCKLTGGVLGPSPQEQRRRTAELDVATAQRLRGARWRGELSGQPLSTGLGDRGATSGPTRVASGGSANLAASSAAGCSNSGVGAPVGAGRSKFGSSIAEALQLRNDERDRLLLRRLQRQRELEKDDVRLAEKDVEVGVFVTPAYRSLLQRHLQQSASPSNSASASAATGRHSVAGDHPVNDDDDSPIDAYLRELDEKQTKRQLTAGRDSVAAIPPPVVSKDYYARAMMAPIEDERLQTSSIQGACGNAPRGEAKAPEAPPSPHLAELLSLVGAAPPSSSLLSNDHLAQNVPAKSSERPRDVVKWNDSTNSGSGIVSHARLVFKTREVSRQRCATKATIEACARRCDERIAKWILN